MTEVIWIGIPVCSDVACLNLLSPTLFSMTADVPHVCARSARESLSEHIVDAVCGTAFSMTLLLVKEPKQSPQIVPAACLLGV